MSTMSTRQICEALQVSRNWVNDWLRPLGGAIADTRSKADIRTVHYYTDDILRWLNTNAQFSRQTRLADLTEYADPAQIESVMNDINSIPDATSDGRRLRKAVYYDFLSECLPGDLYDEVEQVNPRSRGQLPWIPMDYHIDRLEQLRTMRQLMEEWGHRSQEMTYRAIYERAMIRVEIQGRTWFMAAPEGELEYPLLLPARR